MGTSKVASAAARVRALNPGVEVIQRPLRLTRTNAVEVFRGHDLVLDGTDNFPTRYVVNDACAELGLPYVWASVYRTQAQLSVFWKQPAGDAEGVDLRDLFPTPPDPATVPSCGDAGVLGALTVDDGDRGHQADLRRRDATAGSGRLPRCAGRPAVRDPPAAWAESTRAVPVADPDAGAFCPLPTVEGVTPRELTAELASGTPPVVIDVREPGEVELVAIPGTVRIPLGDFLADPPVFDDEADVVIHCKTGPRAERAAAALAASGHHRVRTLTGGILAWIDEIAADLPRY